MAMIRARMPDLVVALKKAAKQGNKAARQLLEERRELVRDHG